MRNNSQLRLALICAALVGASTVCAQAPAPFSDEDLEFLEFIAEFDTGDEEWTDPLELEAWQRDGNAHKRRVRREGEHNDIND